MNGLQAIVKGRRPMRGQGGAGWTAPTWRGRGTGEGVWNALGQTLSRGAWSLRRIAGDKRRGHGSPGTMASTGRGITVLGWTAGTEWVGREVSEPLMCRQGGGLWGAFSQPESRCRWSLGKVGVTNASEA